MATYKDRLPTHENELASLQKYTGFMHTRINILGDLDPKKIEKLDKKGWDLEISEEELKGLIDDFTNIYGYILKNGRIYDEKLVRGTTTDEAEKYRDIRLDGKNKKEITSAWSTTTDIDIAKTFCEYGKAALIRIYTGNVPCVEMESIRDENLKNEDEILILPFAKVKLGEFTSDYNGYKYYDIALEKQQLPDISDEEIENLKKKLIPGFKDFVAQAKEMSKLSDEYERLMHLQHTCDREDIKYIREKLEEIDEKYSNIRGKVKDYRNEFSKMLKGSCRQRELDIEKKIEDDKVITAKEEERRKKEQETKLREKISDQYEINKSNVPIIDNKVGTNIINFSEMTEFYRKMSEKLGIVTFNSSKELSENTLRIGNDIVEGLYGEIQSDNLADKYINLKTVAANHQNILEEIKDFPEIIDSYNSMSFKEVKEALNEKIQRMIRHTSIENLSKEEQEILKQKDNIINKILGKTRIKQARLKNIAAQKDLIMKSERVQNPKNSVNNALYDMYKCAYMYNGGALSQDMQEMENAIRSTFTNILTKEQIEEKLFKTLKSGLLHTYSKPKGIFRFIKNRNQAEAIEKDTQEIENKADSVTKLPQREKSSSNSEVSRLYAFIQNKFEHIKDYSTVPEIDTKNININYFSKDER